MKSDRPEGRLDKLLDEMMDGADDVHDEAGHIAESIDDLTRGAGPSGHVTHTGHAVYDRPQQTTNGVNDAVGASVILLAGTAAAVRHIIVNHRREHQRDHSSP